MPFQKTFRILLEDNADATILDSSGDNFLALNATDSTGAMDADSILLGVDASQSEAKPGWLSEAADGSGDYAKEKVIATDAGWAFMPGSAATGNDNTAADPEVLACVRQLKDSIDVPTPPQITIGNSTSKTTFYPDGDTFTGASSSSAGDLVAYVYFNESVNVTGTPQLQLKQGTNLNSNFSTAMPFDSTYSELGNGIMAFALAAGTDTRTTAVTNNTLGVNSDDAVALNSGRIDKIPGRRSHDKIALEGASFDENQGDAVVGIGLESGLPEGHIVEEGGLGMAADLTLTADADASFTVS